MIERGDDLHDFVELWDYRELLFLLAWRDATVRYKQSVVGIGWALIQPLMMMAIFTVVFTALVLIWLTSAYWFFSTFGVHR